MLIQYVTILLVSITIPNMVHVLYILTAYLYYVTSSFQAKYKKAIYVYINISVQRSTFCVCVHKLAN